MICRTGEGKKEKKKKSICSYIQSGKAALE